MSGGILSEAAAAEVRRGLIDECVRRLTPNLRPDADLRGEAATTAVREVLDEIAADARAERDSHAGRGGVVFSHACDRLAVLGESGSSAREQIIAPALARLRQERAARERDERTARGMAEWRAQRCAMQADAIEESIKELQQIANERRGGAGNLWKIASIEVRLGNLRRQS
jgi:hypothetical protein